MTRRKAAVAGLVVAVASTLVGGCTSADGAHDGARSSLRPHWTPVSLPLPPGPQGRIAVRDATACASTWYAVGAVVGPDATRPAAWTSADGHTWQALAVEPTTYYARRSVLTSVACRDGRIAAVGARSGGAHGNPRVSSWHQRGDGALVDVVAPFTLFGGSQAVDVGRLGAGPRGWMIAGNRTSGAAVWTSADATAFRLLDGDPALAGDRSLSTSAVDVAADGTGWTVVGRAQTTGRTSPAPMAWTSPDGSHWAREDVPAGTSGYADLQRVVPTTGGLVAVGLRGGRLGAWVRAGDRWRVGSPFGRLDPEGRSAPFVSGLASVGGDVLVSATDGTRFGLWAGRPTGRFTDVATPVRPTATGDHQLTVAASGDTVLLLADDGAVGRAWVATWRDH